MISRLLSYATYLAATGLGIAAFLYPFFSADLLQSAPGSRTWAGETPLVFTSLLALCLLVLLFEMQGQSVDAKLVALLGVLVAINAALRFIEVTIPGPGGFSPVFFMIILTGYVFGGRFGFLLGALTLFVSALLTGGFGPWLPGQMFAAGWVGMSASLCHAIVRALRAEGGLLELLALMIFGAAWGLLYGAIINLWSWPFIAGPSVQAWDSGTAFREALQSYGVYYLVTSLAWDLGRSLGNVFLIAALGAPTLRALRRFKQRFGFHYQGLAPVDAPLET
ncbi:MAG: ECF transporter S component [Anaerolineales bacterium]|nr:ECF transporter S component [Anaerolineales bacterium]